MDSSTALADQVTIGARLQTLRLWRGMRQEDLADLAGVKPSQISMWENGRRLLDRRRDITALARALQVSETDLVGGPHLSADPVQSDPHRAIGPIRTALQTNTLTSPASDRARPLDAVCADVTGRIEHLRRTSDLAGAGHLLPDAIDELYVHLAAPQDEAAYRTAAGALTEACVIASAVTKETGYIDLASLAAQRAEEAAVLSASPVMKGKADFMWLMTLPRSAWDRNLAAAEQAVAALEPHAKDSEGLQVLGMLTLCAGLSAAVVQRGDAAADWLAAAKEIGSRVPDDPGRNWQSFSATNVAIWTLSIAVERGEGGGTVRRLAGAVDLDRVGPIASRRAGYWMDAGRGFARDAKTRNEAVRCLRRAEDAAPQRVRNSGSVRDTVAYLMHQALQEAGGRELRGMASRMGVQP